MLVYIFVHLKNISFLSRIRLNANCDDLKQYKFIGKLSIGILTWRRESKKLVLPALRYLVCKGGSSPVFKQAKVVKHLVLLVSARGP